MDKVAWTRRMLFGSQEKNGWIMNLVLYALLLNIAYLYLNPLFYMVSTMFKNQVDLLDPSVRWIPRSLEWNNLKLAWEGLNYVQGLVNSLTISGLGAIFHVMACALAGYAFAKFNFPGKSILFGLLILSFLIPPQTIVIPMFLLIKELGWMGTKFAIIGPAMFGHGIRGSLFVIIFTQFFRTLPKELDESARIEGAGSLRILLNIVIPLAKPAILVVFLFSFIWHWNETYMTALVVGPENTPLTLSLNNLQAVLKGFYESEVDNMFNETIRMSASFLIIMPPLILYAIAQRWFVEGVERTGLIE
ncbi:carbohydrate ABC transporter permease [Paenibacillus pasadenensis]|uniref:carbohydrate ABC transporter permease n=1 Tax=Paenibacillus pasadenensis TaxID=217090 RepID=UPI00203D02C1|nr:carbohydrate ABC transporter permease [Paenibacillus pasadenensis]MCM3748787.1 carbohydrate ABC transporter permease [Paenibacillus pasadenensis]